MIKVRFLGLLTLVIAISANGLSQDYMEGGRMHLPPKPSFVSQVKTPVQSLSGTWEVNLSPTPLSVTDYTPSQNWKPINVPGEAMMQGFKITTDTVFLYRKKIDITENTADKRHIVRFSGVYSHAKVYCNGRFVREHFGGFTAWDADITPYINSGKDNWISVAVTDRADEISYASGYAHHPIGGILRKVDYLVLPKNTVDYLYVDADLDETYTEGLLNIRMLLKQEPKTTVSYTLVDSSDKALWKSPRPLTCTDGVWTDLVKIPNAKTWTSEEPYLYKLNLQVLVKGKVQQAFTQFVGFRKVVINQDKQLLVNGKSVKLRGACRHDIHPLLGRSTNRAQDSLDVVLAKEANFNFIRTSHYPPSEDFLEFCDRYGIYVQEETAICFVLSWRGGELYQKYYKTMDDLAFTDRYLGQLSEMIDRDRNHASVIMWSMGNESDYGTNFLKEYEFTKKVDPSRPTSWSFTENALKGGKRCFDIVVSHYPGWDGHTPSSLGQYENEKTSYPIIGDEWAHVACYNTDLITYDPNVKDFWGKSLDLMWANHFDKKHYIGGAIWGMIDEIFYLEDEVTGYGPWGIFDVWRRKKPEFWNTKKAYSPIRLYTNEASYKQGRVSIPVYNRFDHTNLKDIEATLTLADGKTQSVTLPDVMPHHKGVVSLDVKDASFLIQFKDKNGLLIDEEKINTTTRDSATKSSKPAVAWSVDKTKETTRLKSDKFSILIDNKSGKIRYGKVGEVTVITGSPLPVVNKPTDAKAFKNSVGIYSGDYIAKTAVLELKNDNIFVISTKGVVDSYSVEMTISLNSNGEIDLAYSIENVPEYIWDIGLGIPVDASLNKISWERKGYWTTYPAGHLSEDKGTAVDIPKIEEKYRTKPLYEVSEAVNDYYIAKSISLDKSNMLASEGFRSKKENIYQYTLSGTQASLVVNSNGKQGAKMNVQKNGDRQLLVADKWDYWNLAWGNYQGTKNTVSKWHGEVHLKLDALTH